jgi:hypothetical protein
MKDETMEPEELFIVRLWLTKCDGAVEQIFIVMLWSVILL